MNDNADTTAHEANDERLKNFRTYAASYIDGFLAAKDRISHLLRTQKHASGIYREALLKELFQAMLPSGVSVDSGFIYAYDVIPPSRQLDIIVWDSGRHAPVFRNADFVIVPPESVIAVLSVKSNLQNRDIDDGLRNLLSVAPIELRFRNFLRDEDDQPIFPPITKILVAYETRRRAETVRNRIAAFYTDIFSRDRDLAKTVHQAFASLDPFAPKEREAFEIWRVLPRMVGCVAKRGPGFFVGYGPPDDILAERTFGTDPPMRRLPYIYEQSNILTTAFEKIVYEVLKSVYGVLGTLGWSMAAAWIDIAPDTGTRVGDAWEIDESTGAALLDPDRLAG